MRAKSKAILASIEAVRENIAEAGMLLDWNDSVVEFVERGKRRVTWATTNSRPGASEFPISSVEEYLTYIVGRHYQLLLKDGSLIQMSYDFDHRNTVISNRLVWYPCPVHFIPEELELASIEEMVQSAPTNNIYCRAPIRIDYSPSLAHDNHSATHAHLGAEDFRLPVQRALEPRRFIRLVVRTAYPEVWAKHKSFRTSEDWGAMDSLDADDKLFGALMWNPATT